MKHNLPTQWSKDQLREIYYRLIDFEFLPTETGTRPDDFLNLFYGSNNQNAIHFDLDGSLEKRPIGLCIVLRIVGWNFVKEIPWTDIDKSFHFQNCTRTFKNEFDSLNVVPWLQVINRSDMSFVWNDWMRNADFIFERLDLLTFPVQNRGYLCPKEEILPILSSKYDEKQLGEIFFWSCKYRIINTGLDGTYDFVHIFNTPLCKNDDFVKINWCGTLKQLSLFIEKILKHRPQSKEWETVVNCFSYKENKDITSTSIRSEYMDGSKNGFGDTSSIEDVFSKIK